MIKRKSFFIAAVLIAGLFFVSCEENFSPKGEFNEQFALTCIIRGDTSFQVATLYSSYDVEGFDPYENEIDPAYLGADIRLWYQDTVFVFKDSLIERQDDSRYNSPFYFYYLDTFKPEGFGELLEIEATLSNGKRLKAKSTTPARFDFDRQETSSTIPAVNTPTVNFVWQAQEGDGFYVGRLRIKYFQNINGENVQKYKEVPLRYIEEDGEFFPILPAPSKLTSLAYSQSAIDKALAEISEGDPNKSNYTVSNVALMKVLALDENLSRYYSAGIGENNFTVRLDQTDYSNVEGGFGIFGNLVEREISIQVLPEYIQSFDYKVFFEN